MNINMNMNIYWDWNEQMLNFGMNTERVSRFLEIFNLWFLVSEWYSARPRN
jgi:hypothetical protein